MTKIVMALLALVALCVPTVAQLKDMPTQAELDPILENADNKVKGFLATLTEFKAEAAALDEQKLNDDLEGIENVRKAIQVTHSSNDHGKNGGVNMERLVVLLTGLDDLTLDAAVWKSLAELRMCQQIVQHQNPDRYDQFGLRVNMNQQMLNEVGRQLFHPTFRLSVALDEILIKILDAAETKNENHK
jgi:hypothetical protein